MRQFLATERPLKMMKTDFYFTVKALFVLEIFQFLLGIFDHVGKWRDQKAKINFKTYDVKKWITNNYNTHLARYFKAICKDQNEGGNAENQVGNDGNVGNQGGNAGNKGGNVENECGNAGNRGGNAGNQGGNEGNQCGNLLIRVEMMNKKCEEG